MKKYSKLILLLSVTIIAMVGCIKDNGFDNNEYGIKDPAGVAKGVGFSLALNKSNSVGLDAVSTNLQIINDNIVVNLLNEEVAPRDVKVNFVIDNSLIDKYNAAIANTTDSIRILKPANYTLPSTFVTIPAGQRLGQLAIKIPTTVPLSLDSTYAIALRIVSNDGGYVIAENMKTLLLTFSLKNKYDGRYSLNGLHNRPPYNQFPYTNVKMDMITSGPASVRFYIPITGFNDYGHPIGTAPGVIGWYGPTVSPNVYFDPITNLVTNVNNADATGPPISIYTGALSGTGRYDAVAKKIYVYFRYNANDARGFTDTLTYISPRP